MGVGNKYIALTGFNSDKQLVDERVKISKLYPYWHSEHTNGHC